MNISDVIKECIAIAKKSGLTFCRSKININGSPAYCFKDRKSGRVVLENMNIGTAYDNCCSEFIESYNIETGSFNGVNIYKNI